MLCKLVYFLVFYSFIEPISVSAEAVKTWMPSTNYWDASNWDVKRIPCFNDMIIFPSDSSSAVALHPGGTSLREMVLPLTGEVLLAENGELTVTGQYINNSNCVGESVEFVGSRAHFWLDSANWNGPAGKPLPGGENSPVPHNERVPCETDQVVFMNGGTFQVQLPDVPIKVGLLNIQGQSVSEEQLHEMTLDDTGYHVFKGDASQLQVTGELCQDPRGCICNVDLHPLTWQRICSFEKPRCPPPPCESPVTPRGFCCPICGASIEVSFKGSWAGMKQMIESMIEFNEGKSHVPVLHHISRIAKDKLQIILRDSDNYIGQSVGLAIDLKKQFDTVVFESTPYTKLSTSGDPITSWGSAGRIVLTTLMLVAIVFAVVLLANYLAIKIGRGGISIEDIQPSFLFARFENANAEAGVEIAQQQAFHNPMFSLAGGSRKTLDTVAFKDLEEKQDDSDASADTTPSTSTEKIFSFDEE